LGVVLFDELRLCGVRLELTGLAGPVGEGVGSVIREAVSRGCWLRLAGRSRSVCQHRVDEVTGEPASLCGVQRVVDTLAREVIWPGIEDEDGVPLKQCGVVVCLARFGSPVAVVVLELGFVLIEIARKGAEGDVAVVDIECIDRDGDTAFERGWAGGADWVPLIVELIRD